MGNKILKMSDYLQRSDRRAQAGWGRRRRLRHRREAQIGRAHV